jgi:hypothetical protein
MSDRQQSNCRVARLCFCPRRLDVSYTATRQNINRIPSLPLPRPRGQNRTRYQYIKARVWIRRGALFCVPRLSISGRLGGRSRSRSSGSNRGETRHRRSGGRGLRERRTERLSDSACGVLDGGALRVMPSARLDPCVCDAGSVDIIKDEVEVVDVDLEVEAQRWESSDFDVVGAALGGPPPLDHSAAAGGRVCGRGCPGPTGIRSAVGGGGAARTGVGEGGSSRF